MKQVGVSRNSVSSDFVISLSKFEMAGFIFSFHLLV